MLGSGGAGQQARERATKLAKRYGLPSIFTVMGFAPLEDNEGLPDSESDDTDSRKKAAQNANDPENGPTSEHGILGERVGDFVISRQGVYYLLGGGDQWDLVYVCAPLHIEAETMGRNRRGFGKLLSFSDSRGNKKQYHMKASASSARVIADLIDLGLRVGQQGRTRLPAYLHSLVSSNEMLSTTQPGWFAGSFVLPDETCTPSGGERVLYAGGFANNHFRQSGTLAQWQRRVANLCPGNPMLTFATSASFAAPLLRLANVEGGGFHFCGESSTGKSTTLQIASSVYGTAEEGNRDRYLISFDSTKGAMEEVAEALNDCLFACDELGLVEPKILGSILYMLANGIGKARMGQRERAAFRLMLLTSGEKSIKEVMEEAGMETKMGQEVRLLQITIPKGGMGVFSDIKGYSTPAEFADHIKKMTGTFFGEAFRAWIRYVVDHRERIAHETRAIMRRFTKTVPSDALGGIAPRAAARFGVVAAAGEIAAEADVVGWPAGLAFEATVICFRNWEEHFRIIDPGVNAIGRVRQYLLRNSATPIKNGAYLIKPGVFEAVICTGVDPQAIARHLDRAKLLVKSKGRLQWITRISGKLEYFYAVKVEILPSVL